MKQVASGTQACGRETGSQSTQALSDKTRRRSNMGDGRAHALRHFRARSWLSNSRRSRKKAAHDVRLGAGPDPFLVSRCTQTGGFATVNCFDGEQRRAARRRQRRAATSSSSGSRAGEHATSISKDATTSSHSGSRAGDRATKACRRIPPETCPLPRRKRCVPEAEVCADKQAFCSMRLARARALSPPTDGCDNTCTCTMHSLARLLAGN
jgi:hypothetical protein